MSNRHDIRLFVNVRIAGYRLRDRNLPSAVSAQMECERTSCSDTRRHARDMSPALALSLSICSLSWLFPRLLSLACLLSLCHRSLSAPALALPASSLASKPLPRRLALAVSARRCRPSRRYPLPIACTYASSPYMRYVQRDNILALPLLTTLRLPSCSAQGSTLLQPSSTR